MNRIIGALSAVAVAAIAATGITVGSAQAATTQLCQLQATPVAGGTYTVQNNEWGSSAPECVTTDGGADFTVANSSIANATNGAPGGYPSVYRGCHWGACTSGSGFPIQVSALHQGVVTSSWNTTETAAGAYDVAYDIWFNQTPTTPGQPNGAELMVWINHNGPPQPFGSKVATTTVDGVSYDVWFGNQGWNTISYVRTSPTASVTGLDIDDLTVDAVGRGYIQNAWYLIDVEAGFELWQGGAGLATNSFSVTTNGTATTPPPTSPPPTTPPPTSPPPVSGSGCSAAYSVTNSWAGGFQGQVVVTNTGGTTTHGWSLGWALPGDQAITNMWNAGFTQTGQQVHVTNLDYDGALVPGTSATVGFTSTSGSADPAPPAVTCSAS